MASAAILPALGSCGLSGAHPQTAPQLGAAPRARDDVSRRRLSLLTALNARRSAADLPNLTLSPTLDRAALAHARDLSGQVQTGHRGTDGSMPTQRAARTGYAGHLLGEVVARSTSGAGTVLSDWLADPDTAAVLLDPAAQDAGLALHVDAVGTGWWVVMTGTGGSTDE